MRHNIYAYRHKVARKRKNKQYTKGVPYMYMAYTFNTSSKQIKHMQANSLAVYTCMWKRSCGSLLLLYIVQVCWC